MNILDLPKTEKEAVAFLQERGILQKKRRCRLDHNMKLYFSDRIYWRCTRRSCRSKVSMRVGNWFEGSRLSFVTAIRFIYGWSHEQTSLNWCDHVLNMEKGTAVAWNGYMREVAAKALDNSSVHNINTNAIVNTLTNKVKLEPEKTMTLNSPVAVDIGGNATLIEDPLIKNIKVEPEEMTLNETPSYSVIDKVTSPAQIASKRKIGGKDRIVEVDESQFTNYKNKSGRVFTSQWIIGGLCRETKECFLVRVLDRNAHTLLSTIAINVKEDSTVYTDNWCGYDMKELEDAGLQEFKHKYNFVDSSTGILTQNVQRMWGSAKWRSKKQRGMARKYIDSYLAEFMWRTQLDTKDPFDAILDTISQNWPPEIYSHQWHS